MIFRKAFIFSLLTTLALTTSLDSDQTYIEHDVIYRILTGNNAGSSKGYNPASTGSNGLTAVAPPTSIPTNETGQSYTTGTCPDTASSVFDLTGLTDADRAELVNAHNFYRSIVAQGLSPGQPGATDMLEVYWDDGLANRAQIQADLCVMEHDTSAHRATITFPSAGQNIAMKASSAANVDYNLTEFVQMWYDEVYDLSGSAAPVDSFANVNGIVIGHYTQLVWAKSYAIGCGFKFYEDTTTTPGTTWYTYLLYCNYGPAGNYLSQKMYTQGTFSAAGCEDGASPTWEGLCIAGLQSTGTNPPNYGNSSSNSSNGGNTGSPNTTNTTNSTNSTNTTNTTNTTNNSNQPTTLPIRTGANLTSWAGVNAGFMPASTGSNGLTPVAPPSTISSNTTQNRSMGYCPTASGGYLYNIRGLTSADKAELVNAHNYFRSLIAQGKTKGQPVGADLFEVRWDDGLASRAQLLADSCVFQHDSGSNRATNTFAIVGQNLAALLTPIKNAPYNLTMLIGIFYNEAFLTKGESLTIDPFIYDSAMGHYSQLAWSNTYAIGCGFIMFEQPTATSYTLNYMLACNYALAGNWNNGKMYTPASFDPTGCPNGASASWQNLCATPTSSNIVVTIHDKIKITNVFFTPNISGFYNHQNSITINPVVTLSTDYSCSWYIGATVGSSLTIPAFTMGPAETHTIAITCTDRTSGKFYTIVRKLQTKTPPTVQLTLNATSGVGTSSVFYASIAGSTGSAPLTFRIGYYLNFNNDFSLNSATFGSPIFAGTTNATFTLPNPTANASKVVVIAIVQDSFGIAGYDLKNITLDQLYIPDPTNFAQDLVNKTYTEPTALIKDVSIITSLVNFSAPSNDPKVASLANQLATSIVSTTGSSNDSSTFIQAAKLLEPITSNPTTITKEVASQLVSYLTQQLSGTPSTPPTVDDSKVLLNLISNTFISFNSQISTGSGNPISTDDSDKVQAIMGLTDSVAKQLTSSLAEGQSQVISSSTVSIVVQKISTSSPISLSSTDATSTSSDGLTLQVSLPQLPASFAAQGNVNVVFKVWADNPIKQVTTDSTENTPTSKVVSLGVLDSNGEPMTVTGLNPPLTLTFTAKKSSNPPTCNYLNTTTLQWQSDGCTLKSASDEPGTDLVNVECECTHMTDFGVINRGSGSSEFEVLDLQLLYATIPMTIIFVLLSAMFGVLDSKKGMKGQQGDPEYDSMTNQARFINGIKNSHNFISLFTRVNDPYPRYVRALTYLVRWYMINFVTALLYVNDSVSLESAGSIALSSLISYIAVFPLSYLLDISCMERLPHEQENLSKSADKSLPFRRIIAISWVLFLGVGSFVPTYAVLHDKYYNFTLQWNVVETFLVQIGWDFLINQQLKVLFMMILVSKLSDGKAKSFFKNVIHQRGHGALPLNTPRSPKVAPDTENAAPQAEVKTQEHENQKLLDQDSHKQEEKAQDKAIQPQTSGQPVANES